MIDYRHKVSPKCLNHKVAHFIHLQNNSAIKLKHQKILTKDPSRSTWLHSIKMMDNECQYGSKCLNYDWNHLNEICLQNKPQQCTQKVKITYRWHSYHPIYYTKLKWEVWPMHDVTLQRPLFKISLKCNRIGWPSQMQLPPTHPNI